MFQKPSSSEKEIGQLRWEVFWAPEHVVSQWYDLGISEEDRTKRRKDVFWAPEHGYTIGRLNEKTCSGAREGDRTWISVV